MVSAAVVNSWGTSPQYQSIDLPAPTESQVRIKVIAAGLHQLVRSRATGQHYSVAHRKPPHVLGTDGVGTIVSSGKLAYFNCMMAPTGSFAQEINVEKKDMFELPDEADADKIAVLANPTMSGWMALTARVGLSSDSTQNKPFSVAIIGATGVSGHAAVQVAKTIGATKIVAVGKAGPKLEKTKEVGATATIELGENADYSEAADVDIVLDYLWGNVAETVVKGIVSARKTKTQRLTWVEIGAVTGDNATVSSAMLRSSNVVFMGCGPGSWSFPELNTQMPIMLKAMVDGGFTGEYKVEKLDEVEKWWTDGDKVRKLVKP